MNFIITFLALLWQQQGGPGNFMLEWGFEPRPLRCQCSAPPVELLGQLGAGGYVC